MLAAAPTEAVRPSRRACAVRLVAYTLLLFASWNHNVFGVPTGVTWYRADPRADYYGFDSFLVLNRLHSADAVPTLYPLVFEYDDTGVPVPYRSQFGGQGIAFALVQRVTGIAPVAAARIAVVVSGLLAGVVFASVFAVAGRRFGPLVGDVAVVLACPAPVVLQLAPSPYWVLGLVLGPFALVWACGRTTLESRRKWNETLAAVGLMAFAKSLCGYEFITTMLAAPVAALWFHQHRAGVPVSRRWRAAAALVAVGIAGFAVAVGCHAAQLKYVLGDDPAAVIGERALTRTVTSETGAERWAFDRDSFPFLPEKLRFPANCFVAYFRQPAISTPFNWGRGHSEASLGDLALVLLVGGAVAACRPVGRDAGALLGAAALALAAAASWQLLASNHMCAHPHMNLVVYHLGFVPLALILVGCGVDALAGRIGARELVSWALLAFVLGSAAFTAYTTYHDSEADAAADRAAVEAVEALAANGQTPWCGRVACSVDGFGTGRLLHPNMPVEAGWAPADREPLVLLTGWATDLPPARPFRAPRLVVIVNGKVIPAFVSRCGRPVYDRRIGWKSPAAGFLIVIPRRLVPDPTKLRVYAVSADDPTRVTAATTPGFQP